MVAIIDQIVWIKISGRANFTWSLDLKKLIDELWRRGHRRVILELRDCITMDSTFLGELAGIALKFAEARKRGEDCSVEIANSNARISDTLENVGMAPLFQMAQTTSCESEKFEPLTRDGEAPSREDLTRNCLEAHKTLMALDSANIGKFKDVKEFLEDDLKRLQQAKSG